MNSEEFVFIIKQVVEKNTIGDVLTNLVQTSGRSVDYKSKYLSEWYKDLDTEGKECVSQIIRESVSATLFGFFCVLDGVRAIENDTDKGTLELYFSKNGDKVLLNDFNNEFLHDIYNGIE